MQFNIIFKTIFEYIHKKFRFVHTNTFCEYRTKLRASPRVHLVIIMIADINKDVASSKLISFADDTKLYNKISDTEDYDSIITKGCKNSWASENNMFLMLKKSTIYLLVPPIKASNKRNIYINPSMDIIPQSTDVADLGIIMSKDCSFDSHISSLSRKCKKTWLAGYLDHSSPVIKSLNRPRPL